MARFVSGFIVAPAAFRREPTVEPCARGACRGGSREPGSVRAGPGLFLDDEVALDGEYAAAPAQIEQLYEFRVDVELMTVFA